MRAKAISAAAAIVWGGTMLLVGLVNLASPGYGSEFLRLMGSVYPGFHAGQSFGSVVLGAIYGLVDGAIAGYIFGAIYQAMLSREQRPVAQTMNRAA